jgi:hypothetical protein
MLEECETNVQRCIREAIAHVRREGRCQDEPTDDPERFLLKCAFGFVVQDDPPSVAALEAARIVAAEAGGQFLDPEDDPNTFTYREALDVIMIFFEECDCSDEQVFEAMDDAYERAARTRCHLH